MNVDRVLDNRTLLAVRCLQLDDRSGRPVVVCVAKLTWEIDAQGVARFAVPRAPIRYSEQRSSSQSWSGLAYASDMVVEKPGTDLLLVGKAHPANESATHQDVTFRVETGRSTFRRNVRVYGPRVWTKGLVGIVPGPPARLRPTPLVWELTWGGYDDGDPANVVADMRNPAGTGVAREPDRLLGRPTPQIEDPEAPIGSSSVRPAGFGPIDPGWSQRLPRYGTMDEAWRRRRAPIEPVDHDPRFACTAPDGMWSAEPLVGGESVEVLGATPDGAWRFRVPSYAPSFKSYLRGVEREHATHLDTLIVDAEKRHLELVWRVAIAVPKRVHDLDSIQVSAGPAPPEWLLEDLTRRLESEQHAGHAHPEAT